MSKVKLLKSVAGAEKLAEINMAEVQEFAGKRLLPKGRALARLVEVVEVGKHAQEYNGKKKKPALECHLAFAVWGTPPGQEESYHYVDDDGVVHPGIIRPYPLTLGNTSKNGAKLAFDKMNWKGDHQQFWQMLGEAFLIEVGVKEKDVDGKKKKYNTLDLKATLPAIDPVSGSPYDVPDLPDDYPFKLFVWADPNEACWESIYIETPEDADRSYNFLQEKCIAATDFEGSPLEAMLSGLDYEIPSTDDAEPEEEEGDASEEAETDTASDDDEGFTLDDILGMDKDDLLEIAAEDGIKVPVKVRRSLKGLREFIATQLGLNVEADAAPSAEAEDAEPPAAPKREAKKAPVDKVEKATKAPAKKPAKTAAKKKTGKVPNVPAVPTIPKL